VSVSFIDEGPCTGSVASTPGKLIIVRMHAMQAEAAQRSYTLSRLLTKLAGERFEVMTIQTKGTYYLEVLFSHASY
jgi:hypothetical protein